MSDSKSNVRHEETVPVSSMLFIKFVQFSRIKNVFQIYHSMSMGGLFPSHVKEVDYFLLTCVSSLIDFVLETAFRHDFT